MDKNAVHSFLCQNHPLELGKILARRKKTPTINVDYFFHHYLPLAMVPELYNLPLALANGF